MDMHPQQFPPHQHQNQQHSRDFSNQNPNHGHNSHGNGNFQGGPRPPRGQFPPQQPAFPQQSHPNHGPVPHNQRFPNGPDHNDRGGQHRQNRGGPNLTPPMQQHQGPPPPPHPRGQHQGGPPGQPGNIKNIYEYVKGMRWDQVNLT